MKWTLYVHSLIFLYMFQKKPDLERPQILEPHCQHQWQKCSHCILLFFFKKEIHFNQKQSLDGPEWQLGVVHCRVFGSRFCSESSASSWCGLHSAAGGQLPPGRGLILAGEAHLALDCPRLLLVPWAPSALHFLSNLTEGDVSPKHLCNLRWFGKGKHTLYSKRHISSHGILEGIIYIYIYLFICSEDSVPISQTIKYSVAPGSYSVAKDTLTFSCISKSFLIFSP